MKVTLTLMEKFPASGLNKLFVVHELGSPGSFSSICVGIWRRKASRPQEWYVLKESRATATIVFRVWRQSCHRGGRSTLILFRSRFPLFV